MLNLFVGVLCLWFSVFFSFIHAEPADIVVTASKTAITAEQSIASISVLDAQDIARLQLTSLTDALNYMASVQVVSSGGAGSQSDVYIRGTNSDHLLTLIDGVPVGSVSSGNLAFQYLPIELIERIELVRGSRSSLYGADGIGGIIQIFTRRGKNSKSNQLRLTAGAGSFDSYQMSGQYDFSFKENNYTVGVSQQQTQGYDFIATSGNKHGYDNLSFNFSGHSQLASGWSLNHSFIRSQGNSEFDGSFVNNTDFVEQTLSMQLAHAIGDNWQLKATLGKSDSLSSNYLDSSYMSQFDSHRFNLGIQSDLTINDAHILTLGADYERASLDSNTMFTQTSRWNKGLFAQYQWFGSAFDVVSSVRYDNNQNYADQLTNNLAIAYQMNNQWKFSLSYARAFKAPTFNDLYYPLEEYPAYFAGGATSSYSGNINLKPESSDSFELGMQYKHDTMNIEWNIYRMKINNLIEYITSFDELKNHSYGTMENVATVDIDGAEIIARDHFNTWYWQAQASVQNPRNKETGMFLPRRSRLNAMFSIDKQIQLHHLGLTLHASSHRFEGTDEQYVLPGFMEVDVRYRLDISKHWQLKLSLNNIFDKKYSKAARFALSDKYYAPGRNIMLNFSYQNNL